MPRMPLALAPLLLVLAAATPAAAARPVQLGIGEQKASMFDSPLLAPLELRHARYIAPWDALKDPNQRTRIDAWMAGIEATGMRPLIGFGHSLRSRRWAKTLPSKTRFARAFRGFRERYPDVRDWIAWNEANHPASLTDTRPRRAAQYFDAMARECPTCRIVAADVLDTGGMAAWIAAFRRHVRHRPRIWGLHNYVDANQRRSTGTRTLLDYTGRGEVWFTETGGVVLRREYEGTRVAREFRYGRRHQQRATRQVLRLACLSPRIRRVYLYHWQAPYPVTNWDSAFLGPRGRKRPAYDLLRRHVRRNGPVVRCR
jgi:hypothetical protein